DGGAAAEDVLTRIAGIGGLEVQEYPLEEAEQLLDRSAVTSVAVIPAGFTEGLSAGELVTVTFRQRGSGGDEGQIVASIFQGVVQDVAGEYQIRHSVRE